MNPFSIFLFSSRILSWPLFCISTLAILGFVANSQNCSDGYDDVFRLALQHFNESGSKPQVVGPGILARPDFASNCRRCQPSCRVASQYRSEMVDGARIVVANGIPNHKYEEYGPGHAKNPNDACSNPAYMALDPTPMKGASFTPSGLGPVGLALSGAFLFNHLANPSGYEDVAAIVEDQSFDTCMGHSAPGCVYHYHRAPNSGCIANWDNCTLVGWLRDGFPVYSYCRKGNKPSGPFLKTCYEKKSGLNGDSTSHYVFNRTKSAAKECDLDEANGYAFPDAEWNGGKGIGNYGYVFSEEYPFIMPGYYGQNIHPVIALKGASAFPLPFHVILLLSAFALCVAF